MTGPMSSEKKNEQDLTEEEKRQLQSQQDKENQRREDQSGPNPAKGNHSQKDKQIAPEQRSQDDK
ncbi:hypothetical protein LG288_00630 [Idiomarina seosinensis]|uniref:hypothetical protein n=1 Tax=Idiomarina seosinensis TaxID=281739 RepID=UPI00384AF3A7